MPSTLLPPETDALACLGISGHIQSGLKQAIVQP